MIERIFRIIVAKWFNIIAEFQDWKKNYDIFSIVNNSFP